MDSTTDLHFCPIMCLRMWPGEVLCSRFVFVTSVRKLRSVDPTTVELMLTPLNAEMLFKSCTLVPHNHWKRCVMMSHIIVHLFACLHSRRVSLSACDLIDQKAFLKPNVNRPNENCETWNCWDKTSLCWFGTSTWAKISLTNPEFGGLPFVVHEALA